MLGHSTELEPGLLARLIYCRLQYLRPLRCHTWVDPFAWVFISGKAFVGNWNGHSTHNGTFMMQRQQLRRQRLAIYKPSMKTQESSCTHKSHRGIKTPCWLSCHIHIACHNTASPGCENTIAKNHGGCSPQMPHMRVAEGGPMKMLHMS
eukprot:157646-Chlamydomonas_euryale.AAC.7